MVKELPNEFDEGGMGQTGDQPKKLQTLGEGADWHLATGRYINQLASEWSDPSNSAHKAANEHLNSASKSMLASIHAHGQGDFDAAINHFHSAVLRVEAADQVATAEDPVMSSGKDNTARLAFSEYKKRFGRQR